MKKITFSLILLFVFTFTAFAEGEIHIGGFANDGIIHIGGFADGDIHIGGKSCPQNQNCLVQTEQTESDSDNQIFSAVRNFLDLLF